MDNYNSDPVDEEDDLDEFSECIAEFNRIWSSTYLDRIQAFNDKKFVNVRGAQWSVFEEDESSFQKSPRFEFNKIKSCVNRLDSEYRSSKIEPLFYSKGDEINQRKVDTIKGIYRADEHRSKADTSYINGYREAIECGYGAWRLSNEYENEYSEDDDDQRICFGAISDAPMTVFFDLDAQRQDKKDATRCFVLFPVTLQAAQKKYPGAGLSTMPTYFGTSGNLYAYYTAIGSQIIYLAEYYECIEKKDTVYVYRNSLGDEKKVYKSELKKMKEKGEEDHLNKLRAMGYNEVRRKTFKRRRVHKKIMSGSEFLEDCGIIAGPNIPIVPVYGYRYVMGGMERFNGEVRHKIDIQRLTNFSLSKLAQITTLSAESLPIFFPEEIGAHQTKWAEAHIKRPAFLTISPIRDENNNIINRGGHEYTKPSEVPPALSSMIQFLMSPELSQDLWGVSPGAMDVPNNVSGKAIELQQTKLDVQDFVYISNMGIAIQRSAEIWLGMAAEVYGNADRMLDVRSEDGALSRESLVSPIADEDNAVSDKLDWSKIEIDVDIGPATTTRRSATLRAVAQLIPMVQDPEIHQVLVSMAIMNLEGEGLSDLREFFRRKLVDIGAVSPTEEEIREKQMAAQNQQPDPAAIAQIQLVQASAAQAEASAKKAMTDSELNLAKTQKTKADTLEVMHKIQNMPFEKAISALDAIKSIAPPKGATDM